MRRGSRLGPYILDAPLGAGGMSSVVRAFHHETNQRVALKAVMHDVRTNLHSLRREVRALRSVAHPNIVHILDDDALGTPPWYAMELIDGLPLGKHWSVVDLARRWNVYLRAFGAVCDGLAYAHGQGFVHRDLKPANVVLRAARAGYGDAVIVDFGLVTMSGGGLGRERIYKRSEIIGTPQYISPEQVMQDHVDARADLYSLGVMLYEVVVGRVPFVGDAPFAVMISHVKEAPVIPRDVLNRIPPQLAELIHALLEKEARNRPGYATDVRSVLATLGDIGLPVRDPAPRTYLHRPTLVGREAMTSQMLDIARDAADGKAGVVKISGSAGAGKSRIAIELIRYIHEASRDDLEVLVAEIPNTATSAPLASLRTLFEEIADICFERGPKVAARLFDGVAGHITRYLPFLATVPGVAAEDVADVSRDLREAATLEALSTVFRRLAEIRPLLIVLDDIQWCDPLTSRWLETLPQRRPWDDVPLTLVAVARDGEHDPALLDGILTQHLKVPPLSMEAVAEMTRTMTGIASIPVDFGAAIQVEAQGLPSRVAQWLSAAVARGALVRDFGRWRFHGVPIDNADIHDTVAISARIEDLLVERVRSLTGYARAFLELAVVLGPELRTEVLAHFGRAEIQIVDDLLKDGIFVELTRGSVRFVSPELYDVARESLGEASRKELHVRAAAILESIGAPEVEIAHHLTRAGWKDEARMRLYRAASKAFEAGEWVESERLYRAHAEVGFKLIDHEVTAWSRIALLAWRHGTSTDDALRAAERAARRECGPLASAEYWRAQGLLQQGTNAQGSLRALLRAQRLVADHGEFSDQRDIAIEVGRAYSMLGDHLAARTVYLALHDRSQRQRDEVGIAVTLGAIGATWLAARRYAVAESFLLHAATRFREFVHHPMWLADTLHNLGLCCIDTGRPLDAMTLFEEASEIRGAIGDMRGRAMADISRANAMIMAGRADESVDLLAATRDKLRRQEDLDVSAQANFVTGKAYANLAHYTEAMDHFVRALALAKGAVHTALAPYVHLDIATLDRRLGMYPEAHAQLHKVAHHAPDPHAKLLWEVECGFLALATGPAHIDLFPLQQAVEALQLPPTSGAARGVDALRRALAATATALLHGEPRDVVPPAFIEN